MSGKGTFLGMFFSFAPVVGVEHFRVFLGQERCVFFCAPKKNACGHPLHLNLHLDLELLFYLITHPIQPVASILKSILNLVLENLTS